MKRLLLVIACLVLLAGPAGATTFDFVDLQTYNVASWITRPDTGRFVLGVSSEPGGPLLGLNGSGELNPLLQEGSVYYLYAGNLNFGNWTPGSWHMLNIFTDYLPSLGGSSPSIRADFTVTGTPGSFSLWNNFANYYQNGIVNPPSIYLGWAQGTADMVSPGAFAPDGVNDIYLVLGIGVQPTLPNPIPLPGAVWLLGSGLLGLGGISRWRRCRS
jgi:hypothetical protein